jgi:phosphoglycolate phosphatase
MDSAGAITRAIQAASRDLGMEPPTDAAARKVIGLGLTEALQAATPNLPPSLYPKIMERYRHHYLRADHDITLFPGIAPLLDALAEAGLTLAVATGKSRLGLARALEQTGLNARFSATRCADECASKPDPQMLHELMEELGGDPRHTLMIGDTTHDLEMAKRAGCAALAVTYGAHPREALAEYAPMALLHSVPELSDWFFRRREGFAR